MKKELTLVEGREGRNLKSTISSTPDLLPNINKFLTIADEKYGIKIETMKQLGEAITEGAGYIKREIQKDLPVHNGHQVDVESLKLHPFDVTIELTNDLKKHHLGIYRILQILTIKNGKAIIDEAKVKELDERSTIRTKTPQQAKSYEHLQKAIEHLNEARKAWTLYLENLNEAFWFNDNTKRFEVREDFFKKNSPIDERK